MNQLHVGKYAQVRVAPEADQLLGAVLGIGLVHGLHIVAAPIDLAQEFGLLRIVLDPVVAKIQHGVAVAEITRPRRRRVDERVIAVGRADAGFRIARPGGHHGGVHIVGVIAVHADQLPVAQVFGLVRAAVREDFARRRRINHQVDDGRGAAEVSHQRLAFARQARENEPPVAVHARNRRQAHLLDIEIVAIGLPAGDLCQRPVGLVGPAVVPAAKKFRVAGFGFADHGAPVPAPVHQHADLVVAAAHHDDWRLADGAGLVITGLADLAFMADVDPRLAENPFDLKIENCLIGIDARMHAFFLHQRRDVFCLRSAVLPLNSLLVHLKTPSV